ncbi:4'-phosphopantetheinyl transferase family protein, partial [Streptomyces sp. WM6386]|uniref:4'-phosphopantetheinyl transferase family protein n=1 Tax=Streptomyces sp. WM6386 TaxID=1415558 RepID=UPI003B63E45E
MSPARSTAPLLRNAHRLTVDTHQIHLWVIGTEWAGDHPEHMVTSELDDRERERAAAFVRPLDRLTYLMAHIALRRLLSAYTGIPPAGLPLGRDTCPCCGGPHGRPVL